MSLAKENVYETTDSLNQYLDLHYNGVAAVFDGVVDHHHDKILPHAGAPTHALDFPQRVGQLLIQLVSNTVNTNTSSSTATALDVGGSVGGTAFELATHFSKVDSFDNSHSFVETAQQLQRGDTVTYSVTVEGDETIQLQVPPIPPEISKRVRFFQGDACNMADIEEIQGLTYDAIVLANLLCRLPHPRACLNQVARLVTPGTGIVLLVTPFTWLEQYTSRDEWIRSEGCGSLEALTKIMHDLGFDKIHDEDMPLVIREHARKYQYIISKATGWKKRQA